MKQTRNTLLALFWGPLVAALLLAALFELDILPSGQQAQVHPELEFIVTTVMELATIGLIPLSLKLMKLSRVRADLVSRKAPALRLWGTVRLLTLHVLLLLNTLLYYLYINPAFGYLAIILLLCLPFVYPSEGRCQAETEETEEE